MTATSPHVEVLDPADLPDLPDDFDACEDDDAAEPLGLVGGARGFAAATQFPITWLPAAMEKWGAKYRIVAGFADRGRPPSSGAFRPKGGITVHHTGSKSSAANPHPALGVVTNGRPGLTGPLCQASTDYNGVTTLVAAGRANHAGKAKAFGAQPAGDGNAMYIGNEVDTNGTQTMPAAQYDGLVLFCCAVLDHYGIQPDQVGEYLALHATTSESGKWDLGAGNGTFGIAYPRRDLVADVAARLAAGPNPTTPPEDDMPTPADLLAAKVTKRDGTGRQDTVGGMLADSQIGVYRANKAIAELETKLTSLSDSVKALAAAQAADPAAIAAAIAPLLPQGGEAVSDAQLEAALRKVLGSVDGATA